MPRKLRLFVPTGIYHVYNRVHHGRHVFDDALEAESWVATAQRLAPLHELTVFAWCLMSNHYHLVVRTGSSRLWRGMARIQAKIDTCVDMFDLNGDDIILKTEILNAVWSVRNLEEADEKYDLWNLPSDVTLMDVRLLERDYADPENDIFAVFRAKQDHLFSRDAI